jgi:hypothetical protein
MMIAVEGIQPKMLMPAPPRMSRHSSLLQFATANAAYTSAAGAASLASQQDVLLLLRNKYNLSVVALPSVTAPQVLPSCYG